MNVIRKTLLCVALLSIVGAFAYRMDAMSVVGSANGAQRAEPQKEHLESDHEKREAALRKAMPGSVDIFFDITQVEADKPMIANAKFVDLVDVTGKDLIRFSDAKGHHWLIDPDTVLTFRMRSK